ncbi:hypothetical protein EST38_g6361 [Candolleomyces aberdarensis]|uniref:SnoaL-like domain-containing protein n=1 Tax=Candolleomyces aberdarensis TaxID=2316362 RepID=A0A4Q2DJX7_9AGAR|nr:hypothetical protein EST38_g6361 [Candolleomyces aberdarensis]
MHFKLTTAFGAVAVALTTTLMNVTPAVAKPAGTVALENWMLDIIPQIFPNTTTNWQPLFDNDIIVPDVKLTFNARTITGRDSMRALWEQLNQMVVARTSSYVLEPTGVVAFSLDDEGHNGWVIATGATTLTTKRGRCYTGGGASAFVSVVWNETLQARTITEWKEVNTPPNYPNYPWS